LQDNTVELVLERLNGRCLLLHLHCPKGVKVSVAARVMQKVVGCVQEVKQRFPGEKLEGWVPCPDSTTEHCCHFDLEQLQLKLGEDQREEGESVFVKCRGAQVGP
jgi:hypothetical protein